MKTLQGREGFKSIINQTKHQVRLGFKACKILPLDPKVMDDKIWPFKIYIGIK